MLRDAKADITAFADFPEAHWRKVWPTNPLERLIKEVKRRTDVVGIFPDDTALLRLAACVLIEAHAEWQVSDRRYCPKHPWPNVRRQHQPRSNPDTTHPRR
jgi:putative transposase